MGLDRGGVAGGDGQTHHGLLDIAYLRPVPNIILMAPKDEGEMRDMLYTMIEQTMMSLPVASSDTTAVHAELNVEILNADVVNNLVEAAL